MSRINDINERELGNDLYEKEEDYLEPLTPTESLVMLAIIHISRSKGEGCVRVRELAEYLQKRPERIRILLNELKNKGEVTDSSERCFAFYIRRVQNTHSKKSIYEDLGIYDFAVPRGGVEKYWTTTRFNPLNDEEVKKYLKEIRPEIIYHLQKMMSGGSGRVISQEEVERRIYKFLGIKIGNEEQSNYMDKK